MTYRIYHNPRCSKSRQGLQILEDAGIQPEVVRYLDKPPNEKELLGILDMLEGEPADLVRSNEDEFKQLGLAQTELDAQTAAKAIARAPKLLQRPVVVAGDRAVIGRPPEKIQTLIDETD